MHISGLIKKEIYTTKKNKPIGIFSLTYGMLQELKSERTKKLILDKAYELFYEEGFKSSSIDRIVKASHLTKGAFYHHFKSKKN